MLTPISAGLGLVDIAWTPPPGAQPSGRVIASSGTVATSLISVEGAEGVRRWRGRLMLGPTASPVSIEVRGEGGPIGTTVAPTLDPGDGERTPDWAKGTTWYQVFPERFRNGHAGNDPTGARDPRWFHLPWTANWYRVSDAEIEGARNRAVVLPRSSPLSFGAGGLMRSVLFSRRCGGDLQGVEQRLDDLHDLGIEAVYCTPVFRAASLHKYDAADFRHIDETLADPGDRRREVFDWSTSGVAGETADPATWGWTPADRYVLDALIPAVKSRGMRLVFDGVWNHTGQEHFAFQDLLRQGAASPFAGWYAMQFVPDPKPRPASPEDGLNVLEPGDVMSWKSWGGGGRNGYLPVFAQTPQGDLNPGVKAHLFAVTKRWLDPRGDGSNGGIDGWRLDVAPDIPVPFWTSWRAHVKAINPDAVLIGEVWFPAAKFFHGRGFDGQMNYPFAMPVVGWLGQTPTMTSTRLTDELRERALVNHPATDLAQMNLLDSHDTDRVVSMLFNPGRRYDGGQDRGGGLPAYKHSRPPTEVYELSILGVAIQATFPGSPMIYYGNERGMWGGDDPDNRKPVPWPDAGAMENPEDAEIPWVRDAYAGWLRLRRDPDVGPTLKYGMIRFLESGSPDVFAFERRLNSSVVTVAVNRGAEAFTPSLLLPKGARPIRVAPRGEGNTLGARSAGVWVSLDE